MAKGGSAAGGGQQAGSGGLIRGKDGKLHMGSDVAYYGGSLNGAVAPKDPWADLYGGGRTDVPPPGYYSSGPGKGTSKPPPAGTTFPGTGGGTGQYNPAAARAIMAMMMAQRGG